jgi:hypothetical protein
VLVAWLYHVTRRRAIDVVRREAGRRLREETAQELQAMNATAEDWTHIEPLLDDAMDALEETDRLAVLLRYFQNKPLHEVGQAIGVTDDAAQKRVSRAVERLREFFAKRGVSIGASGLVLVISANGVQAAPVGLAVSISAAVALAGTTFATTAIATAAKAIAITTSQKALIAVALATAVATGFYEARQATLLRAELQQLRQSQAEKNEQVQRERDQALARLSALADENDRLKSASTELLKLRAEVTRLRAAEQELARLRAAGPRPANPPTVRPVEANETELGKDSWADVGFATPQATLRTRGWSVLNNNLERFAESVVITDRTRKAFEDAFARMVESSQNPAQAKLVMQQAMEKKFAVEEGLLMRLRGENIGGGYTGYRIQSQQSPSAEETVLEVETQMESRPPRKEFLTFRRFGNDWKIVVDKDLNAALR